MTDPTAYHRKLADALWKRCWLLAGEADKTFIDKHDFAAALAAEGVVDPEDYKEKISDLMTEQNIRVKDFQQQLAAVNEHGNECEAHALKAEDEVERLERQLAALRGDGDD